MATSEESRSATDVVIAHSGLAEEFVVLEWLAADGQSVEIGDPLVVVESEKTQIEIDAPATGRLDIVVPASDMEVDVGTTIGRVWT